MRIWSAPMLSAAVSAGLSIGSSFGRPLILTRRITLEQPPLPEGIDLRRISGDLARRPGGISKHYALKPIQTSPGVSSKPGVVDHRETIHQLALVALVQRSSGLLRRLR